MDLHERFPRILHNLNKQIDINTRKFSIIVAEEFVAVSTLAIISILTNNVIYYWCCISAFTIHLIIHLVQFIYWRGYIPAIVTSIFCIPYCIVAIHSVSSILVLNELLMYAVISFIVCAINFYYMHKLVSKIQ